MNAFHQKNSSKSVISCNICA